MKRFLASYSRRNSYCKLDATRVIKNEHDQHHTDVGQMRVPGKPAWGVGGAAAPRAATHTTDMASSSRGGLVSGAAAPGPVLPAPDVLCQFCALLILTVAHDDNGVHSLPKYTLWP